VEEAPHCPTPATRHPPLTHTIGRQLAAGRAAHGARAQRQCRFRDM